MRYLLSGRPFVATVLWMSCVCLSVNKPAAADDLFDAIDAQQVAVTFIPVDATKANVLIENLSDHIVRFELPDAIAAVPVLAQIGQGFGQPGGQNVGQNGGGNQSIGGGVQAANGQGFGNNDPGGAGPNGFGIGMMCIPPGKTRKLTAATVCLEFGKREPNPRIPYRMIRIADYTEDTRIVQLCQKLGRGEIETNVAQAVAWNLASGMRWGELAKINRIESKYRGHVKYFSARELVDAEKFARTLLNADNVAVSTGSRSL